VSRPIPLYLTYGLLRPVRGTALQVQEYIALLDYGKLVDRFDVVIGSDGRATAWCGDTMRPEIRAARCRFVAVRYGVEL
jgi:hypothetical protein